MSAPIRCRNIHAAARLGAPIVAYSGVVCRLLGGDAAAAALLCQLWYLTGEGERPTGATAEQLEADTGLSAKVQRRARRALAARGWVSEARIRRDGRTRIYTRVNAAQVLAEVDAVAPPRPVQGRLPDGHPESLDPPAQRAPGRLPNGHPEPGGSACPTGTLLRKRSEEEEEEKEQERQEPGAAAPAPAPVEQAPTAAPSAKQRVKPLEADVLAGRWDDHPDSGGAAMCALLCAVLCREWHRDSRFIVPSKQRQQVWRDFVLAGGRASDALKAISGMRHDDWNERGRCADLRHVVGKIDVWVRYYEERHLRGASPHWPRAQSRVPAGFRPWKGIWLPADREPTHGDQLALEAGYVFAFDARQWVDPLSDPGDLVDQHREKYGEANMTPTANARIEAGRARRARG